MIENCFFLTACHKKSLKKHNMNIYDKRKMFGNFSRTRTESNIFFMYFSCRVKLKLCRYLQGGFNNNLRMLSRPWSQQEISKQ
jgi:hypothetical protein